MPREISRVIHWGHEAYCPINIDAIRLESAPNFPLYFRSGPGRNFILYCERGVAFTLEVRKRLVENKIAHLFIQQGDRQDYSRYLADHLAAILHDPTMSVQEKTAILYDSSQAMVEELFTTPFAHENVSRVKEVVRHTVDLISDDNFRLEDLLRNISCDYYIYTHSVNVVAYSVALAMQAGYNDHATLREIANGALLHDVGKSKLPREMLDKNDELSEPEWEQVRQHPQMGFDMLSQSHAIGEIALDIVLHHHERLDGSGYPHGLINSKVSPFVRIVAVADVFDALTTDRFHQPRKTSFQALHTMQRRMFPELDVRLVRSFIEMLGITPRHG